MISGDNPLTVSNVAVQAGISHADRYVDASKLSEEEYEAAVEKYTVFWTRQARTKENLRSIAKA